MKMCVWFIMICGGQELESVVYGLRACKNIRANIKWILIYGMEGYDISRIGQFTHVFVPCLITWVEPRYPHNIANNTQQP